MERIDRMLQGPSAGARRYADECLADDPDGSLGIEMPVADVRETGRDGGGQVLVRLRDLY
jgi:hypothetical protein